MSPETNRPSHTPEAMPPEALPFVYQPPEGEAPAFTVGEISTPTEGGSPYEDAPEQSETLPFVYQPSGSEAPAFTIETTQTEAVRDNTDVELFSQELGMVDRMYVGAVGAVAAAKEAVKLFTSEEFSDFATGFRLAKDAVRDKLFEATIATQNSADTTTERAGAAADAVQERALYTTIAVQNGARVAAEKAGKPAFNRHYQPKRASRKTLVDATVKKALAAKARGFDGVRDADGSLVEGQSVYDRTARDVSTLIDKQNPEWRKRRMVSSRLYKWGRQLGVLSPGHEAGKQAVLDDMQERMDMVQTLPLSMIDEARAAKEEGNHQRYNELLEEFSERVQGNMDAGITDEKAARAIMAFVDNRLAEPLPKPPSESLRALLRERGITATALAEAIREEQGQGRGSKTRPGDGRPSGKPQPRGRQPRGQKRSKPQRQTRQSRRSAAPVAVPSSPENDALEALRNYVND